MTQNVPTLAPGTLPLLLRRRTERALGHGALLSIKTEQRFIEQNGVRFLVRSVSNLARRDQARVSEAERAGSRGQRANPFLPYDQDLFVANLSETHVCLLNKFNVIDHHLLVVTRDLQDQETLLTAKDFQALWACMAEINGLAFYNAGTAAGASQPHKHLQLVPLPLADEGPAVPMDPLLETGGNRGRIDNIPGLPFEHAFCRLDPSLVHRPLAAAEASFQCYRATLDHVGLAGIATGSGLRQSGPYNLLFTRTWMLLVPRSREHFDSISINALGFAGSLFVRDEQQMEAIERRGPMTALSAVALPRKGQS